MARDALRAYRPPSPPLRHPSFSFGGALLFCLVLFSCVGSAEVKYDCRHCLLAGWGRRGHSKVLPYPLSLECLSPFLGTTKICYRCYVFLRRSWYENDSLIHVLCASSQLWGSHGGAVGLTRSILHKKEDNTLESVLVSPVNSGYFQKLLQKKIIAPIF